MGIHGGEAKRDYPASINYQAPWYKEYPLIEDHFARVNTAMTRGTPLVHVGVIHPIESYWLHWGPSEQTAAIREQMDNNFKDITEWLLFGQIDFDFICESLLLHQCAQGGAPLKVGDMAYDTIIIPNCQTLRSSTVERLRSFLGQGGRLIVMGEVPKLVDAVPANNQFKFLKSASLIPFEKYRLLEELEPVREVDIRNADGERAGHFLTQIRQDDEMRWLFIANGRKPQTHDLINPRISKSAFRGAGLLIIRYDDWGDPQFDTSFEGNNTVVRRTVYMHDSMLLHLKPHTDNLKPRMNKEKFTPIRPRESLEKCRLH